MFSAEYGFNSITKKGISRLFCTDELIQARWGRALYHAEILAIHGKCPKETSNLLCYGHLPYI